MTEHQLVIKFWRASLADEAFLATIERDLDAVFGTAARTDGIDTSAKEINLFVSTTDPRAAFRKARPVLEAAGVLQAASAGSRVVGGLQFASLWPPRPMRKFKLP